MRTSESDRREPLSWHQARLIAHAAGVGLPTESVTLDRAVGRHLAREVRAVQDIPHFASSAMDGWLVSGDGPWHLITDGEPGVGEGRAIVTGGVVPDGSLAVLPMESAELVDETVHAHPGVQPAPSAHVRPTAGEAKRGDLLIDRGVRLNPAHIAVAAACGIDDLTVAARPRVAVLLTGDEVDDSGVPVAGRVRDSFGPQLPALLRMIGADTGSTSRVVDRLDATVAAIRAAAVDHDLIVTTGGTGSSAADQILPALEQLGATFAIPGVAMRPGAPTSLALLPDGTWVVALPGNPLAAIVGLLTVGVPLLAGLADLPLADSLRARVGGSIAGRSGRTQLIPARLVDGEAVPAPWLGSAMMRGLAESDVLLVVPEKGIQGGETAEAIALPWTGWSVGLAT